jgi:F-type H+-transporting ATPase subunit delta
MTSRAAAMRYARALFDVVVKEGDVARTADELTGFADIVAGNETLHRVLSNPAFPVPRKRAVVEALLAKAGNLTPALAKLLLMLAERDRLPLLPELAAAYRERLLDHQNVVRADIVTAVPLPPERHAAIARGLAAATGRKVDVKTRVDSGIIGGAVAKIGSTVYDGSIARQLERLQERLTENVP